jgi:glucokinase
MGVFIGLDIGGSSLKLGAWRDTQRLAWLDGLPVPASSDAEAVLAEVAQTVRSFASKLPQPPLALGVGSCGIIREGVVYESPNTAWDLLPVEYALEQELGFPVLLLNDADAFLISLLAERTELASAIGLTLGTGLGTAVWLGWRLLAGGAGISPEGGHITLELDGAEANTGIPGTWESLACKAAVLRYYAAAGGSAEDPLQIAAAAERGDTAAMAAWARYGYCLGAGLGSLCNLFSPQAVLIGGGLAGAHRHFEAELRRAVDKHMLRAIPRPAIEFATERADAVAHGAARYASLVALDG